MISKKPFRTGKSIKTTFLIALLIANFTLVNAQNAVDYLKATVGTVWKYDVYTTDNSNNIIPSTKSVRYDSLIGKMNYRGKESYLFKTNWDMYNNVAKNGYADSSVYAFNGATASEYCYLFTPPYKGEFLDVMISEIRDRIVGWYDFYQFDKPVDTEYEIIRYDTAIVYQVLGINIDVDIITRVVGKKNADEDVVTSVETFNAKKFTYNVVITAYLHLFGNVAEVVFADFPVIHWITNDKWIVKEWRPTVITTSALAEYGINSITAPGLDRTLTGYTVPKPETPILSLPENNSANVSQNPTLQWNPSNFSETYFVQIATNEEFTNVVYEDSTLTTTLKEISGLNEGTSYFWKVRSKNNNSTSSWSEIWTFTTKINNFLTVSTTELLIASAGNSTETLTITSNVAWSAVTDQSWLKIDKTTGTGNSTINLTADENKNIVERTAKITVTSEGIESKVIVITQAAGAVQLSLSDTKLSLVSVANSSTTFTISSNTNWTITSDQSWLKVSTPTGNGNSIITLSADENKTINERAATITVSATGFAAKTIAVTQAAGASTLDISSTALTIAAAEGSSKSFSILSNSSWSVSSSQTWLIVSPGNGNGNGSVTITANENTAIDQRTAIVTVSCAGTNSKNITITQIPGNAKLLVSTQTLTVDAAEGSTANFNITSNATWSAVSDQSWLTVTPASGEKNATVIVAADANKTTLERSSIVTIAINDSTKQTVTVTQKAGEATLAVSQSSLNINAQKGSTATFTITSNTTWKVSSDQSWLTTGATSGSGDEIITLTAEANTSGSARTALITVTVNDLTTETITVTQATTTSTNHFDVKEYNVYPNPCTSDFTIKIPDVTGRISVYNTNGKIIFSKTITDGEKISAQQFREGLYIIELSTDNGSSTKRLLKKQ